jgi:hypothetical protein
VLHDAVQDGERKLENSRCVQEMFRRLGQVGLQRKSSNWKHAMKYKYWRKINESGLFPNWICSGGNTSMGGIMGLGSARGMSTVVEQQEQEQHMGSRSPQALFF